MTVSATKFCELCQRFLTSTAYGESRTIYFPPLVDECAQGAPNCAIWVVATLIPFKVICGSTVVKDGPLQ